MSRSVDDDRFDMDRNLTYHVVGLAGSLNRSAGRAFQRGAGLTTPEWRILAILGNHDDLRFNHLVEVLDVDKGWVSRTLVKLERDGLAQRFPDPDDGRQFRLRITRKGQEVRRRGAVVSQQRQRQLESHFSAEELDQLYHLLQRLRLAVNDLEPEKALSPDADRLARHSSLIR